MSPSKEPQVPSSGDLKGRGKGAQDCVCPGDPITRQHLGDRDQARIGEIGTSYKEPEVNETVISRPKVNGDSYTLPYSLYPSLYLI